MIIVDRFEGKYAVLEENGEFKNVLRDFICKDVKEGDIVILKENIYYGDPLATEKRKEALLGKFKDMWED